MAKWRGTSVSGVFTGERGMCLMSSQIITNECNNNIIVTSPHCKLLCILRLKGAIWIKIIIFVIIVDVLQHFLLTGLFHQISIPHNKRLFHGNDLNWNNKYDSCVVIHSLVIHYSCLSGNPQSMILHGPCWRYWEGLHPCLWWSILHLWHGDNG